LENVVAALLLLFGLQCCSIVGAVSWKGGTGHTSGGNPGCDVAALLLLLLLFKPHCSVQFMSGEEGCKGSGGLGGFTSAVVVKVTAATETFGSAAVALGMPHRLPSRRLLLGTTSIMDAVRLNMCQS
jgi:hypothetical protein